MEKNEKDYSISLFRFAAMVLVFACHVCKQYGSRTICHGEIIEWKNWFNVGVQCFLLISGYLYGRRGSINNMLQWYKKVFSKILTDYYVFVVIMIPIYYLFSPNGIGFSDVFSLITFSGTIDGLGHLWYIPTILFCYFVTPILILLAEDIVKKTSVKRSIFAIIVMLLIQLIAMMFFDYFSGAWVNCYFLGIMYSQFEKEEKRCLYAIFIISVSIAGLMVQLYGEIIDPELSVKLDSIWGIFCSYVHVMLGLTIMICLRWLYGLMKTKNQRYILGVLDWSDQYSYDVYFVHAVFTQGFFCIATIIENKILAILVSVIATVISAMVLRKICLQFEHLNCKRA